MTDDREPILPADLVARLARFRLSSRHRVQGRYAGSHRSRRFGSSLDFADYREYVAGDDPRRVDLSAYQRLGRLLVKLYEAEDEAAIRVVVDLSASMGFGRKTEVARQVTAAFAALAANGQDRVRVLLVGGRADQSGEVVAVDAGPWFRGPSTLPAVEHRLRAVAPPEPTDEPPGRATLAAALRQAHGEGPRGPVALISDLLFDGWEGVLRTLAGGRGDALLVHLLGREDVDPTLRGDLRLVDAETGQEVEVGIAEDLLDAFVRTRDAWLSDVERVAGSHGIAYARVTDDADIGHVLTADLRALGVVV